MADITEQTMNAGEEHSTDVRNEPSDVSVRGVLKFGVALVILAGVIHLALWGLFAWFAQREAAEQAGGDIMSADAPTRTLPSAPRLEGIQTRESTTPPFVPPLRRGGEGGVATDEAEMKSYGWIDPDAGIVRIPIRRAMQLLENKLPVRTDSPKRGPQKPGFSEKPGFLGGSSFAIHPLPIFWTAFASVTPTTGQVVSDVRIEQRINERLPLDTSFRNESGQQVTLGAFFTGKPVILVFAYYRCPQLCTAVLNGLTDSLRKLSFNIGDEFTVITISFDPREAPALAAAKKNAYVERYGRPGAEKGWHFLTGASESIEFVTQAAGFHYAYDPDRDQFRHASGIIVLTPEGRISRYFFGIDYSPRDLRLALVEASENRIGTPVDRVLLLICGYDAATGKYTPSIMKLMRGGAVLTVVVLGAFVWRQWRRDRRR